MQDIRAIETVPLPGYQIKHDKNTKTIQLLHPQSKKKKFNITFKSEDEEQFEK
jgi:hypothetical protein